MAERVAAEIRTALDEQTITVPGTDAAALILPNLAASLHAVLDLHTKFSGNIEERLDAHPLSRVLTSMPGIGVRTGARILAKIGDASTFPTAAHLAAYASLAPVTRRSSSSIRGETPPHRGNRLLQTGVLLRSSASPADAATSSTQCSTNGAFYKPHPVRTA